MFSGNASQWYHLCEEYEALMQAQGFEDVASIEPSGVDQHTIKMLTDEEYAARSKVLLWILRKHVQRDLLSHL